MIPCDLHFSATGLAVFAEIGAAMWNCCNYEAWRVVGGHALDGREFELCPTTCNFAEGQNNQTASSHVRGNRDRLQIRRNASSPLVCCQQLFNR